MNRQHPRNLSSRGLFRGPGTHDIQQFRSQAILCGYRHASCPPLWPAMMFRILADSAWFSLPARSCVRCSCHGGRSLPGPLVSPSSRIPTCRTGRDYFTRAGPDGCDLVVCPATWQSERDNDLVRRLADQAKGWGKPLVVFCEADTEAPFPVPGALVFRGSLWRCPRLAVEFAAPAFIKDPPRRCRPGRAPIRGEG